MLDLPCGDFNWMRHVDLSGIEYTGGDIVKEIAENKRRHTRGPGTPVCPPRPRCRRPPRADLVFCRDCLVHLPYEDIFAAVENVRRSGAAWLATTTFTRRHQNDDLYGVWRPLNLQDPPFGFPEPDLLLEEGCPPVGGEDFSDKSMGFWKLDRVPQLTAAHS